MLSKKTELVRGFSLLELLLVISVGSILILSGIIIYRNVSSSLNNNEAARLISILKQETKSMYKNEPDYSGLNGSILVRAGAVPPKYVFGNNIKTPFPRFRARPNIEPLMILNSASTGAFSIGFPNATASFCYKSVLAYGTDDSNFVELMINQNSSNDPDVQFARNTCYTDRLNNIQWMFY